MASHLTQEERGVLYRLRKQKKSRAEIARALDRHPSTIGREIARNTGRRGYRPKQAQRLADERREKCRRPCKMADEKMYQFVTEALKEHWSPDQIAGRAAREFARQPKLRISDQTIYNWIEQEHREGRREWRTCLRRGGRRLGPTKRGQLVGGKTIEGRPKIIEDRRRFGDWEGDTVVGKGRRQGLFTAVERKSGFLRTRKVADRYARTTTRAARRALGDLPQKLRRSMTLDNGKEFADHDRMTRQLGLDVYFAKPYCAWQRGTNENTNGLIRQRFPKGTDFSRISHQAVARMEKSLNDRPRRRLGYRTPNEVLATRLRCN
jgi:IS30 family transposase